MGEEVNIGSSNAYNALMKCKFVTFFCRIPISIIAYVGGLIYCHDTSGFNPCCRRQTHVCP